MKEMARRLEHLADPNNTTRHYLTQYNKGDQRRTRQTLKAEIKWDEAFAQHPKQVDYQGEFRSDQLRFGYFFGDPTQLMVYDIDDHHQEPGRLTIVDDLSKWLEDHQVFHWLERTRRGFHCYIPVKEPASHQELSSLARAALEAALPDTNHIEIYPSTKGLFYPVNPLSPIGECQVSVEHLQDILGCRSTISALTRESPYIHTLEKTTYSANAPVKRWERSWRDTRPFLRRYWGNPELRQDFLAAMGLEPKGEPVVQEKGLELLPVATTLQGRRYDSGLYLVTQANQHDTFLSLANYHDSINGLVKHSKKALIKLKNKDCSQAWFIQVPTWLKLQKKTPKEVLPWFWKKYGFVLKSEWDAGELLELVQKNSPAKATSQEILQYCLTNDLMGCNRTDRYGWPNPRALALKLNQFGVPRYRSHGQQYYQLAMFKDLLMKQSKGQLALALSSLDGEPEKIRALVNEIGRQDLLSSRGMTQPH